MPLMDRIYVKSFLEMHYTEQLGLIEKVRTIRSSAMNAARVKTNTVSKTAMKRIAKGKTTRAKKDPGKAATAALAKLSPEQIEMIKAQFQSN